MAEYIYKILSPPPIALTDLIKKLKELNQGSFEIVGLFSKANHPYLHWEQLKYKNWIPIEIFPEKELFWSSLKAYRQINLASTPIKDIKKNYFKMNIDDHYNEFLHVIDKEMAGNFMGVPDLSESDKRQFITRNLIEESIASSQLEGANTSRAVAKKMLLEGRKPQNKDEQMIINNHQAMVHIEQELCKKPLSLELIFELHTMITEKTLDESSQGKLRETFDKNGERLVVRKPGSNEIAYIAPDKEFVEAELPRLIAFANEKDVSNKFIHPLIKAIMLHFWIGLLHPFEDGNGRLARILFYWYMLKNDYWAFAYVSISEKIKKSPAQYSMAYIYSEQDDNDLTYFIDYNINQLKLARKEFQTYITRKLNENHSMVISCQKNFHLNERQIKLLQYFHKRTHERTSINAHREIHNVGKNTAIADLKALCNDGFLIKKNQGKNTFYYPTEKIAKLFKF